MAFVQFSKVSLAFGDRDILKSVSLNLAAGSKAALAGANGAGKSTLMKVIAGKMAADSGDRAVQKGTRVSYLPQSGIVHQGRTLREEAELAYSEIIKLLEDMEALGRELEKAADGDSRTTGLVAEHHRIQEEIENSGYYRREASISMILTGLGFSLSDMERQVEEFSGGWQMRIALAKMLLENPDILLLDEPTNYLDIEARAWLESWLQSYTGGYLLVSHDRFFLDTTVNEVFELFQGDLKRYAGNYTSYERIREVELESLLKRYEAQQEEIAKTEALIRRFRYKASKAAFAQELIKRLDKIERIEIPESLKKISITFPPPPHSGRVALTLESIGKSYGERQILSGIDLTLESGEKFLVVGRNGAGKTTLLRIIAGQDQAFSGTVKYGAGISAGYFSQDAAETLTGSQTVLDYMEAEAPTYLIPKVRDMLGAFLFRGDDVFKALTVLSGGEKSRLALLRMLLKPMNLLILDEPTNHLDLQSKDILLGCLKAFTGTVIFVSHDRGFMEALSTKTLELRAGKPHRLFYGDYRYYLDRVASEGDGTGHEENNRQAQQSLDTNTGSDSIAANNDTSGIISTNSANTGIAEKLPSSILVKAGAPPILSAAERREQEKQRQSQVRRLERQEAEILARIERLEKERSALEAELARPEVYSSGEKAKAVKAKLDQTTAAIDTGNREWEEKAAELAALRNPQHE
ncbi:ABC-F family ATP-binding cassette domain-containing protein [Leadbettera azotonutricia]|uniref:ABC transporter, ATP-binding protein n=1 Tax=Leadbettera azotonutricia (strain ATCC BAA-888 / DSM 13862 / ZAS-9) TaxID=545695 RepID=F5YFA1_LEAAZ|nr:ABC-F family ATP-binding cassette domain-containing protein [Leadbettera azotonutricia]AEF80649.1 ABC transporter, ATP-binding protein [Leadbettera azotonutricia ZAS-9]